jgi:hypothetical protein
VAERTSSPEAEIVLGLSKPRALRGLSAIDRSNHEQTLSYELMVGDSQGSRSKLSGEVNSGPRCGQVVASRRSVCRFKILDGMKAEDTPPTVRLTFT